MCRWPSWAGLNEPPRRPMARRRRSPKGGSAAVTPVSRAGLPRAADLVFERRQLLHPHGTAGMQLAGGDADLRPHAELSPVGELSRGVVHDDGAVERVHELLR